MATDLDGAVTLADLNYALRTLRKDIQEDLADLRQHLEGKIADVHAEVKSLRESRPY